MLITMSMRLFRRSAAGPGWAGCQNQAGPGWTEEGFQQGMYQTETDGVRSSCHELVRTYVMNQTRPDPTTYVGSMMMMMMMMLMMLMMIG